MRANLACRMRNACRPLPRLGLFGMTIPTSGRTIPVIGIVVKKMSGLLAASHTGIVKGSAGIVGFNTITIPGQSHVSGIVPPNPLWGYSFVTHILDDCNIPRSLQHFSMCRMTNAQLCFHECFQESASDILTINSNPRFSK